MGFNLKKGLKAIGKDISGLVSKGATAAKKYADEAPQRREKQIKKLKQDIQLEKLREQKAELRERRMERMEKREQSMGGGFGFGPPQEKKKGRYGLF